ncbi:hypothetical protein KIPB_013042, partial [Kipferlia bialata]|eukprot:g13042.t1
MDDTSAYDPLRTNEYTREIFQSMVEKETSLLLEEDFLKKTQTTGISGKDRATLLNWLVGVHGRLSIPTESLWLMVSYFDHYLAKKKINPDHLLLVGGACLLLACKWEQQRPGIIDELIPSFKSCGDKFRAKCRCQNAYRARGLDKDHKVPFCANCTKNAMMSIERDVWAKLDHSLNHPTAVVYIRRFSMAVQARDAARYMAFYFAELCFLDSTLNKYRQSRIAAACLSLAQQVTGKSGWSDTHQ